MQKFIYIILAGVICLQACMKEDTTYEDNVKANEQAIQQYISSKNLQLDASTSGLRYKVTNTANTTGGFPVAGNQIVMSYVGKLTSDVVFAQDSGKAANYLRFPYGGISILPGIYETAGKMKVGDTAVAIMPFYLGFGTGAAYKDKVPAYSPLVFGLKTVAIQTEDQALQDYMVRKGYPLEEIKKTKTASGLYIYFTKKDSTGVPVSGKSSVTITYKGRFLDGSIFDQTPNGQTSNFGLSGVISGFSEGLRLMRSKESAILMMPSSLAYKETGNSGIPPYSPLIFEVTVNSTQ